jgi:type I restriction enzyme S subunit
MTNIGYSHYKHSGVDWLGKVPAHWELKPLFALLREKKQRNLGNNENNVLSLSYGRIIRRNTEDNFGLLPESFETYQIVSPGNIILRLTDLQNDKRSLRVGLVAEPGIITSAYICLGRWTPLFGQPDGWAKL